MSEAAFDTRGAAAWRVAHVRIPHGASAEARWQQCRPVLEAMLEETLTIEQHRLEQTLLALDSAAPEDRADYLAEWTREAQRWRGEALAAARQWLERIHDD